MSSKSISSHETKDKLHCDILVVLGGYKFALEKQVDDLIDDAEKKAKKSGRIPLSNQVIDSITDDAGEAGPGTQQLLPKGGQNRSDRRLKNRLDKN